MRETHRQMFKQGEARCVAELSDTERDEYLRHAEKIRGAIAGGELRELVRVERMGKAA